MQLPTLKEISDCSRKARYETKAEADSAIAEAERNSYDGVRLRAYKCRVCSGWHRASR